LKKRKIKILSKGDWRATLLPPTAIIGDAIRALNEVSLRIVLVADAQGRLVGTVSDGDIRRAFLRGQGLTTPLSKVLHKSPIVAKMHHASGAILQLMLANRVHQIPILDSKSRVTGLHIWDDLAQKQHRQNLMVIMAGGEGQRLRPFTEHKPKPLIEIGGRPILEHILLKALEDGFTEFAISIRYLGNLIVRHFGDGRRWGVRIRYLKEKNALGTAGALQLLKKIPEEPILVTNGDVIADFNYGDLLDFHEKHRAYATIAVRFHDWENPFGVVETKGLRVTSFREKPKIKSLINAGVYVLSPNACRIVSRGRKMDMPELLLQLLEKKKRVIAYPLHENWFDIGKPEDRQIAESHFMKKNIKK